MKQSAGLIGLQLVGIVLGLFSVFWIAGSLPPEVYSIVGIYNVISIVIIVFSNTGLETQAIRNILNLREGREHEKIRLLVTQSLTYRFMYACIIFIPMIGYSAYISIYKYDGEYFSLFVFMTIFSIARAINDSTVLLLRAFNQYISAAFVTYTVNVFGKILALMLFFKYGFEYYIYTVIVLPVIITIPVIIKLKEWIHFGGVFKKENIKRSLINSKSFALSSYISYIYNSLDQLIVSLFTSPETIGSFTVAKNILVMGRTFVENIFDPLLQSLVRYRRDNLLLLKKYTRIVTIRNILLFISIAFVPIVLLYTHNIIKLLHIDHYKHINIFIVTIYFSEISHIGVKLKYNMIALFYTPDQYFKLTLINSVISLVFFTIILSLYLKYVFMYVLFTNIIMIFYTRYIYSNYNISEDSI
jgi:O-antigen/teichoic acid export membrane protein